MARVINRDYELTRDEEIPDGLCVYGNIKQAGGDYKLRVLGTLICNDIDLLEVEAERIAANDIRVRSITAERLVADSVTAQTINVPRKEIKVKNIEYLVE